MFTVRGVCDAYFPQVPNHIVLAFRLLSIQQLFTESVVKRVLSSTAADEHIPSIHLENELY
jgi:hypothetical protein